MTIDRDTPSSVGPIGIVLILLIAMVVIRPMPADAGHCMSEAFVPYKSGSTVYGFGRTTCDGSASGVLHQTKIKMWNQLWWSTRGSVQDSSPPLAATANDSCSDTSTQAWKTDADSDHNGADLSSTATLQCRG